MKSDKLTVYCNESELIKNTISLSLVTKRHCFLAFNQKLKIEISYYIILFPLQSC